MKQEQGDNEGTQTADDKQADVLADNEVHELMTTAHLKLGSCWEKVHEAVAKAQAIAEELAEMPGKPFHLISLGADNKIYKKVTGFEEDFIAYHKEKGTKDPEYKWPQIGDDSTTYRLDLVNMIQINTESGKRRYVASWPWHHQVWLSSFAHFDKVQ